jgi:hypothetical protein
MNHEIGIKGNQISDFLYPPPDAIGMMTPMRIRWIRYVACRRETHSTQRILLRKPEGMRLL